ncbi:MAG: hypothetical protein M1819_001911 [Sarea resinae]|nr:MAG: hypothetical protein M1819_001911 [Sarea resinae]
MEAKRTDITDTPETLTPTAEISPSPIPSPSPSEKQSIFTAGATSFLPSFLKPLTPLSFARAQATNTTPPPPPDGGLKAWTQVLVGHLVLFNTWGFINSFGFFESYYIATLHQLPSAISWIVSIQVFLLSFIGSVSGRATDAGWYRLVLGLGCFFQLLGMFMTSLATSYWEVFLAQGVCCGIGHGLVWTPTVSLISTYFARKRAVAVTVVLAGSSTGGIIFPLVAQQLFPKVGFGWTVRVMAFVVMFNVAVILALARTRLPPRKTGPLFEWAAFREPDYALFVVGTFLILWSTYFAYYYLNSYATSVLHTNAATSLDLLYTINATGIPGRILPALLSDFLLGPSNTFITLAFLAGMLLYVWIAVKSIGGMFAFAAVYGLVAAGVQGMFAPALASMTKDLSKMGARMGMALSVVSVAFLTSAPLAGALIQRDHGGYLYAQIWGGTSLVVGASIVVLARVPRYGWDFSRKM